MEISTWIGIAIIAVALVLAWLRVGERVAAALNSTDRWFNDADDRLRAKLYQKLFRRNGGRK